MRFTQRAAPSRAVVAMLLMLLGACAAGEEVDDHGEGADDVVAGDDGGQAGDGSGDGADPGDPGGGDPATGDPSDLGDGDSVGDASDAGDDAGIDAGDDDAAPGDAEGGDAAGGDDAAPGDAEGGDAVGGDDAAPGDGTGGDDSGPGDGDGTVCQAPEALGGALVELALAVQDAAALGLIGEPALAALMAREAAISLDVEVLRAGCSAELQTDLAGRVPELTGDLLSWVASQPLGLRSAPPAFAFVGDSVVYEATLAITSTEFTFALVEAPSGASIGVLDGVFVWEPTLEDRGAHTITIVASDGVRTATQSFTLVIAEQRDLAVVVLTSAGGTVTVSGTGTALDGTVVRVPAGLVESDTLTLFMVDPAPPSGADVQIAGPALGLSFASGLVELAPPIEVELPLPSPGADEEVRVFAWSPPAGPDRNTVPGGRWSPAPTSGGAARLSTVGLIAAAITRGAREILVDGYTLSWARRTNPAYIEEAAAVLRAAHVYLFQVRRFRDPTLEEEIIFVVGSSMDPPGRCAGELIETNGRYLVQISRVCRGVALRTTVAHELTHVVQSSTPKRLDHGKLGDSPGESWWSEATAELVGHQFTEGADEPYPALGAPSSPNRLIEHTLTAWKRKDDHPYNAFIFFDYLEKRHAFGMERFWGEVRPAELAAADGAGKVLQAFTGGLTQRIPYLPFVHAYSAARTQANFTMLSVTRGAPVYPTRDVTLDGTPLPLTEQPVTLPHLASRTYKVKVPQDDVDAQHLMVSFSGTNAELWIYEEGALEPARKLLPRDGEQDLGWFAPQTLWLHVGNDAPEAAGDGGFALSVRLCSMATCLDSWVALHGASFAAGRVRSLTDYWYFGSSEPDTGAYGLMSSAQSPELYERAPMVDYTTWESILRVTRRLLTEGRPETALAYMKANIRYQPHATSVVATLAPSLAGYYGGPTISVPLSGLSALSVGGDGELYGLYTSHPPPTDPDGTQYTGDLWVQRSGVLPFMVTVLPLSVAPSPVAPFSADLSASDVIAGEPTPLVIAVPGGGELLGDLYYQPPLSLGLEVSEGIILFGGQTLSIGAPGPYGIAPDGSGVYYWEPGLREVLFFPVESGVTEASLTGALFFLGGDVPETFDFDGFPGFEVVDAGSTASATEPYEITLRVDVAPLPPEGADLIARANTLDARSFVVDAMGVGTEEVGLTAYYDTGAAQVRETRYAMQAADVDPATSALRFHVRAFGSYAVAGGLIVYGVKAEVERTTSPDPWPSTQTRHEIVLSNASFAGRIGAAGPTALRLEREYPAVIVQDYATGQDWGYGGGIYGSLHRYPTTHRWFSKAGGGRHVFTFSVDETYTFTTDADSNYGGGTFRLSYPAFAEGDIGAVTFATYQDQPAILHTATYAEMAEGRIIVRRSRGAVASPQPVTLELFIDGELRSTVTQTLTATPLEPLTMATPLYPLNGDGRANVPVNQAPGWNTWTSDFELVAAGGDPTKPRQRVNTHYQHYAFEGLPAPVLGGQEGGGTAELGGETLLSAYRSFFTLYAPGLVAGADKLAVLSTSSFQAMAVSARLRRVMPTYEAVQAAGLPATIHEIYSRDAGQVFYDSMVNAPWNNALTLEERAGIADLLQRIDELEVSYQAAKPALVDPQVTEADKRAAWQILYDTARSFWGNYHTVVVNQFAGGSLLVELAAGACTWDFVRPAQRGVWFVHPTQP